MTPAEALTQLGGTGRHRDILELTTRWHLRAAVASGAIVRVSKDRYCLARLTGAIGQAERSRAYLTHLSAALHHGWAVRFPPDDVQLQREVSKADRDGWATTPLRTLRDCCHDLAFADALAVCDSALRSRSLAYEALIRASQRWTPQARQPALCADARAKNPFGSSLRAIAISVRLSVAAQWTVRVGGLTFHPDVADPFLGLALEADSWSHHAREPADHDRDCERYNLMVLAGWRVLRFTWGQVMLDPGAVERLLVSASRVTPNNATRHHPGVSPLLRAS